MRTVQAICIFLVVMWSTAAFSEDYVIGDGDGLQISVWGESNLNAGVTVRPDGKITLPGIGDVTASGFTPTALSEELSAKLTEFVKKPIVTVSVTHITNSKIYVFGGGIAPLAGGEQQGGSTAQGSGTTNSILTSGIIPMPARTTLLKFLAGLGMLRSADLERAYIIRGGKKLDVNFYDLFMKADLSKDIVLKSEDMIYIPDNTNNKIYVMGAVSSPKSVQYWSGVRIVDVILEAGGFTKFAKENDVIILRKDANGAQSKEIAVKVKNFMKDGDLSQNVLLLPGDFVIVREGIF